MTTSLAGFLSTLAAGLNPKPDFKPRRDLVAERAATAARDAERAADPDAELVARARGGDVAAFEDLVRRHQARVYGTLVGLTGNAEDAEDCSQAAFIKVFRKIGDFAGAARFSTWLTRIAINEGLERLRSRHPSESLDGGRRATRSFRPFARARPGSTTRSGSMPARRRGGSSGRSSRACPCRPGRRHAARHRAALDGRGGRDPGAPVPTLKTRLLRGRLMLRESPGGALRGRSAAGRALLSCDGRPDRALEPHRRGRGAGGAARALEHHLAECRTCQVLYDSTRKTIRIVTDAGAGSCPAGVVGAADRADPRRAREDRLAAVRRRPRARSSRRRRSGSVPRPNETVFANCATPTIRIVSRICCSLKPYVRKSLDVVRVDLGPVFVELQGEVQKRLVLGGDVGPVVVEGDLLGLGPVDAEHAHDLAVGGHAVGRQVRGRADEEDVLLLAPRQSALP